MNDLAAWQFALQLDPEYVGIRRIVPRAALPLTREDFGKEGLENGELRSVFAQAQGQPLAAGTIAFELELRVHKGGVKLSEVMRLDTSLLPSRVYNTPAEGGELSLVFQPLRSRTDIGIAAYDGAIFELLPNVPNPFTNETTIAFVLPEAATAILHIHDASGRLLSQLSGDYAAGYNAIKLTQKQLKGASGLLSYTITAGQYRASSRMLLVR